MADDHITIPRARLRELEAAEDALEAASRIMGERAQAMREVVAERDAERARADMHADLGRRTAEALGIAGDRSGMPEVAAAMVAERDAARAERDALRAELAARQAGTRTARAQGGSDAR